jgi:hypothetical protein
LRAFFDDWRIDEEALPVVSRSVQAERVWSASEVLSGVPERAKTGIPPGTEFIGLQAIEIKGR